jgi:thymidylate synthase
MELLSADSLSMAWLLAARSLAVRGKRAHDRQAWDLAVEIANPLAEVAAIRRGLDEQLARGGLQTVETVANTIFPEQLWLTSPDRQRFYTRYDHLLPRLRRFDKNRHGLYFDRLTHWPPGAQHQLNQVEDVICRILAERRRNNPLRFVYDMSVFSPANDPRPIGFPCLAYLNVKLDGDQLRLTAHYRNHYFIERSYGNYLGLARLLAFIGGATGLSLGPLTCISGHAELDHAPRRVLTWLRRICEEYSVSWS